MNPAVAIVGALFCVIFAGAFAAAEASLTRVTRREAARWVESGRRGAIAVAAVLEAPSRALNVAVFLRVMLQSLAVALVAAWMTDSFHSALIGALLTAVVMGLFDFVGVGVAPRTMGRMYPERVAPYTVPVLRGITHFLGPIAGAIVTVTNAVTPGQVMREGPFATELELRNMVDIASESQVIDAGERRMVQAVFELGDTLVREVMVPRTDLVTVDAGTDLERAMKLCIRSGFSRIPVIGQSRDDVLGVLYFKDVARQLHGPEPYTDGIVDDVMRPAHFVPDSLMVEKLMEQMQARQSHVAIVVDEYGGVAGLATMEDLLEEIVGEIADEHDPDTEDVEQVDDTTWRVPSRMSLSDLGDLLDLDLEDDEVDTVGGLLAKAIGKVPIRGNHASMHGIHMQAERFEGRRKRLSAMLVRKDPESAHRDDNSQGAQ